MNLEADSINNKKEARRKLVEKVALAAVDQESDSEQTTSSKSGGGNSSHRNFMGPMMSIVGGICGCLCILICILGLWTLKNRNKVLANNNTEAIDGGQPPTDTQIMGTERKELLPANIEKASDAGLISSQKALEEPATTAAHQMEQVMQPTDLQKADDITAAGMADGGAQTANVSPL